MSDYFDYDKAEADLYDSGCPYSEDIYGYRSEKGINEFMRENGLDPDRYYSGGNNSGDSSNNGGCFITTACVEARGVADDCYELNILREFRDNYLKNRANGMKDIAEYYRIAPRIVESINNTSAASEIWDAIYRDMISPCVSLVAAHRYEDAYERYKSFVLKLRSKYIAISCQ